MNENKPRFNLRKLKLPKGGGFYLALSLAVLALGVGVWGTVNNSLRNNPFSAPNTVRSTINWDDYVTRPVEPETEIRQVAEPVRNEPDRRDTTTAAPATTRSDNLPFTGDFALPFGTKITKDFSNGEMVRSATMGDWRVHNGVDFAGERDQEVFAIQDGVVKSVKVDPLWGVVVTIDHGHGIVARYCGLSENSTPKEGREVKKGEALGVIGQVPVESAEGIHLHLEISVNGQVQDPLEVMNRSGS